MTDIGPRRMRPIEIVALVAAVIGAAVVVYAVLGGIIRWLLS